jgi:hypothetical protein
MKSKAYLVALSLALSMEIYAQPRPPAGGQIQGVSGTGDTSVTTLGVQTPGACVQIDNNGNHVPVPSGAGCGNGTVGPAGPTGPTGPPGASAASAPVAVTTSKTLFSTDAFVAQEITGTSIIISAPASVPAASTGWAVPLINIGTSTVTISGNGGLVDGQSTQTLPACLATPTGGCPRMVLAVNAAGTGYTLSQSGVNGAVGATGATGSTGAAGTVANQYKVWRCTVITGDPGAASSVLANDNDSPVACQNNTGVDITITGVSAWADGGSPTVTPILTAGTGTSILTGALTAGTASWAAGTVNGTPTLHSFSANNATCPSTPCTIDSNITAAGGTAKYLVVQISGTY